MKHSANNAQWKTSIKSLEYLLHNEVFEQRGDVEEIELKHSIEVKSDSIAGKIESIKKEIWVTKETIQKAIILEKLDALEWEFSRLKESAYEKMDNLKDNDKSKWREKRSMRKLKTIYEDLNQVERELNDQLAILQWVKGLTTKPAQNAVANSVFVWEDGKIYANGSPAAEWKKGFTVSDGSVATWWLTWKQLKDEPKKWLEKWFEATTKAILSNTNMTPKQASIVSMVLYGILIWKWYQALKESAIWGGSHIRTLWLLIAWSWAVSGKDPFTLAMTFYKCGLGTGTMEGIESKVNEFMGSWETIDTSKYAGHQAVVDMYFDAFKKTEDFQKYWPLSREKALQLIKDNNDGKFAAYPEAEKWAIEALALMLEQNEEQGTLWLLVSGMKEYTDLLKEAKFDIDNKISNWDDLGELKNEYTEFLRKDFSNKLSEKQSKEAIAGSKDKLTKLWLKTNIPSDKLAAVAAALAWYSLQDLQNPENLKKAKKAVLDVIGDKVEIPEDNSDIATLNTFFNSPVHAAEYNWLNTEENKQIFATKFKEARNRFYQVSGGSTLQLSSDGKNLYIESDYTESNGTKKDRRVQLYLSNPNDMYITWCNSGTGVNWIDNISQLFIQAWAMCNLIASCEGKAKISNKDETPIYINSFGKLDYNKQQTFFQNLNSTNIPQDVYDAIELGRWWNLAPLADGLNGKQFNAWGAQVTIRDNGGKRTADVKNPPLWLIGVESPARFRWIKNESWVTQSPTATGPSIPHSVDYGVLDYAGDGATAVLDGVERVGEGIAGAWAWTTNWFKLQYQDLKEAMGSQPDNISERSSFKSYEEVKKELWIPIWEEPLSPEKKTQVQNYLFGKIATYKEFDEALTTAYGNIANISKSWDPAERAEYFEADGSTITFEGMKKAIIQAKPGIEAQMNSPTFAAELTKKHYPPYITNDLFRNLTQWFSKNCADSKYHADLSARTETLVVWVWDQLGDATKKVIHDVVSWTGEITTAAIDELNLHTGWYGGTIAWGLLAMFGIGKGIDIAKNFLNKIPIVSSLIPWATK